MIYIPHISKVEFVSLDFSSISWAVVISIKFLQGKLARREEHGSTIDVGIFFSTKTNKHNCNMWIPQLISFLTRSCMNSSLNLHYIFVAQNTPLPLFCLVFLVCYRDCDVENFKREAWFWTTCKDYFLYWILIARMSYPQRNIRWWRGRCTRDIDLWWKHIVNGGKR